MIHLAAGLIPLAESEVLSEDLTSLTVIAAIAACTPLLVGLLRLKVAEVVLLLVGGVVFGPQLLGSIHITDSITLLSELGLGFLFFLAGYELEKHALQGTSGRLAVTGWLVTFGLAAVVCFLLGLTGFVSDVMGVAIALTSTALGTLLPVLRDSGRLRTPFGTYFMGAGALGEFGPILAISILLGTQEKFVAILTLVAFALIALLLAVIPRRFASERVMGVIERGHSTSSQTALRMTVLLLIVLLTIAGRFGLDVVLGAFLAGVIMRQYSPEESEASHLQTKVEGIAFGMFVPLFFVVSGAKLDIVSIAENPWRLVVFFGLMFALRGLPTMLLYRSAVPARNERWQLTLLIATALPIVVAVTTLELETGLMRPENAAALVGAGALTVLVFPLVVQSLEARSRAAAPVLEDSAPSATG